jgi:hypothetical protein
MTENDRDIISKTNLAECKVYKVDLLEGKTFSDVPIHYSAAPTRELLYRAYISFRCGRKLYNYCRDAKFELQIRQLISHPSMR